MQHLPTKSAASYRKHARRGRNFSDSLGFSLIEVLVSIIILSFGLLGMVGLQAAALQANREARLQSTASSLARELAEMMRGNKDVALLPLGTNPYLGDFVSPLAPATPRYCMNVATSTTPCADTTAIANAELTEWMSRVDSALPGARVEICTDSAPYDTTSGIPRWVCNVAGTGTPLVIKMGWTRGSTDRSKTGLNALDKASVPALVLPVTPGAS